MYCTITLPNVRTRTELFKRKVVSKKLTPVCDVAFAAAWSPCSKLSAMKTHPKDGGHRLHIAHGAKRNTTFSSPQVAQARNMSIGEHRHSKYKDLYWNKTYRFCNLRKWKDFNKKQFTFLKMCVSSLLCGPRADLWPFYGFFYVNSFLSI